MPTTQEFILGMNAKIYYGAAGGVAATEMSNVEDVTLTLEAGEADVTTRANQGWKATAPTLRECTVEFTMLWQPSDGGFAAIKDAYLNGDQVALLVLDKEGGEGIDADFSVTNFTRDEQLTEGITVKVTAKLAKFRAWQAAV